MNPFEVNSEPQKSPNLLATRRYGPTINYHLLQSQKKIGPQSSFSAAC